VADFSAGQKVMIGSGADIETATIAAVGTAGATRSGAATEAGATVIPIAAAGGFAPGQSIAIGDGADQEAATVATAAGGRGGARLTVTAPLKLRHAAGTPVSGSGITLTQALAKAHGNGSPIVTDLPTPGAPNRYSGVP
jgi:hypothetical protein